MSARPALRAYLVAVPAVAAAHFAVWLAAFVLALRFAGRGTAGDAQLGRGAEIAALVFGAPLWSLGIHPAVFAVLDPLVVRAAPNWPVVLAGANSALWGIAAVHVVRRRRAMRRAATS